jgi:hypothetical protein
MIENAINTAGIKSLGDISILTDHCLKLLLVGFNTPSRNFIMALDTKVDGGYWRTRECKRLGIDYKAGRKEKSATWNVINERFLSRCNQLGVPILSFPLFEADDVASLVVKVATENFVGVDLFTVDTDWLGLVSDSVKWLNMAHWSPRLRNNVESISEWSEARLGVKISAPEEIWEVKSIQGDKSDNLPPGTPLGLISLIEPMPGFRLWENDSCVAVATEAINHALNHDPITNSEYLDSVSMLQNFLGRLPIARWL